MWRAILALTISYSAFIAEVFRAGFQSVGRGQTDAARSLGMTPNQVFRNITFPLALRTILPPLGNSVNGLLKATSIASVISMEELMRRSEMIMQVKFDVLEVFAAAAIDYLVLTTLWDQVQKRLERRFNRGTHKGDTAKIRVVAEQA